MKGTQRGHRRFASWQRMTPSARASPKSSASVRFRWDSIAWGGGEKERLQRPTAAFQAGVPGLIMCPKGSPGGPRPWQQDAVPAQPECQLHPLPLRDTPTSSCDPPHRSHALGSGTPCLDVSRPRSQLGHSRQDPYLAQLPKELPLAWGLGSRTGPRGAAGLRRRGICKGGGVGSAQGSP